MIAELLSARKGEAIVASPYVEDRWLAQVLGRKPEEIATKDMVCMAGKLGCELLYFAEGGVDYDQALDRKVKQRLRTVVVERGAGWEKRETTLSAPLGPLTAISINDRRPEDPVDALLTSFMKTEKEYGVFNWYLDRIEDRLDILRERKKAFVARKVLEVGNAGLVCSDGPVSFNLMGRVRRDDLILHRSDFPKTFTATVGKLHRIEQALMKAALESGARIFRFCIEGRERFTRETFETDVLPFLAEDLEILHSQGAFSYIHTCGHMRDELQWGHLNALKPHLVESFTAPPEGDIEDLRWAREMLDPRICTRGNLSLTLLRNGTERAIEEAVGTIVEATRGFRHIVSGTDAVHAGTPYRSIAALVSATRTITEGSASSTG